MSLSDRLEAARSRRAGASVFPPPPAHELAAEPADPGFAAPEPVSGAPTPQLMPQPAPIPVTPPRPVEGLADVSSWEAAPVFAPAPSAPAHAPAESMTDDVADDAQANRLPAGVEGIRDAAAEELYERMGNRLTDATLSEAQLHAIAREELAGIVAERAGTLSDEQRRALIDDVADDALGLGPLQRLLDDPGVSEIMVNGPDHIYVERKGRILRTRASFRSEERLRRVIERIVSRVGRRIDESSPLVDARLPDGSRVNAIIPPLAVGGSALTIRKFAAEPYQARDLVELGTLNEQLVELLYGCVNARLNIVISGGTGTGKTTLLNVLSSFIPADDRVVTIEDAVELQLQQEHVVRLESRPPNIEGRGEVTIRDLVRNSLRMRPDRIIVGECRGGEALDMLQAMNTGHDGSLSTVHANSPRDAVARLETLSLMAGMDLPLRAVREQVASAVDVILHVTRLRDGTRRVTSVTEVLGMEGEVVTLQELFAFDYSAGVDADGRFRGTVRPTGIRPRFSDRFNDLGIGLDIGMFQISGILA